LVLRPKTDTWPNDQGKGGLQPDVNFINILCKHFSHKSVFTAFLYSWFGFVIYCQKNIGAKAARKMLMKSTAGVNFTNILQAAFCEKSVLHVQLFSFIYVLALQFFGK